MRKHHWFNTVIFLILLMTASSVSASDGKEALATAESKPLIYEPLSKQLSSNMPTNITFNKEVIQFLGRARVKALLSAEEVETYQIDWRRRAKANEQSIHGFPVVAKGRPLDALETQIVQALVGQETSYDFLVSKRTRLRPAYALRFVKGSDAVDIILDLQSSQWGFIYNDALVQEDISEALARPVLKMIMRAIFGK